MTTTLSEGVKVPDVGSVNWAGDLEVNWNLLNGALANLSGNVKLDRDNIWTGEQSFTLPIVGSITGTASRAIADEDGTNIKTGYGKLAGANTWTDTNTFRNINPETNSTYALGSSSYQWSAVYAQTYYYNGTQWGLDKENEWTQIQTFKADTIYRSTVNRGTAPGSITYMEFADYKDSSNNRFSLIGTSYEKNKSSNCCIYAYKTTVASGGSIGKLGIGCDASGNVFTIAPTPASSDNSTQIATTAYVKAQGYLTPGQDLIPSTTETYKLGTSTNQWKSVYAQTYYYNGTAWGLDQYNAWTNSQAYKLTGTEIGSTTAGYIALYFTDKNNTNLGFQRTSVYSDGRTCFSWKIYNTDSNSQSISSSLEYYISKAGVKVFAPGENATTDLGTSAYKWKTINGINPGALSLLDASQSVNIDTTGWVTDGSAWNTITSSNLIDGYLYINYSQCSADDYISVRLRTSNFKNPTFCVPANTTRVGNHYLYVCVPVSKLFDVFIEIKTTGTFLKACIFPMLGNV